MSLRATIVTLAASMVLATPALADERESVWLDVHNAARAEFGTAPLSWSEKLEREARQWAQVLAREEKFYHSPRESREGAGENLWMGTVGRFPARRMIDLFVEEKRFFKPGLFPKVSRTGDWSDVGHYTQIVWGETREVGCATARSARHEYLVCRYFPAGNIIGREIAPRPKMAKR